MKYYLDIYDELDIAAAWTYMNKMLIKENI